MDVQNPSAIDRAVGTNNSLRQTDVPAQQTASLTGVNAEDTFDTFLALLTAQLKFQDPLSPMDSAAFTDQLVQFSGVEQQIATNAKLEDLLNAQQAASTSNMLGYIGRQIETPAPEFMLQDGQAEFAVTLGDNAARAQIVITDMQGNVVRQMDMPRTIGTHAVTWDGLKNNGRAAEEGIYRLSVQALNNDGASVATAFRTKGTVSGIETLNGENFLAVGELLVREKDVLSVRTVPPAGT